MALSREELLRLGREDLARFRAQKYAQGDAKLAGRAAHPPLAAPPTVAGPTVSGDAAPAQAAAAATAAAAAEAQRLQEQLAALSARLEDSQRQLRESAAQKDELERLMGTIARLNAETDALRNQSEHASESSRRLQQDVKAERARVAELVADNTRLTMEMERLEDEKARAERELERIVADAAAPTRRGATSAAAAAAAPPATPGHSQRLLDPLRDQAALVARLLAEGAELSSQIRARSREITEILGEEDAAAASASAPAPAPAATPSRTRVSGGGGGSAESSSGDGGGGGGGGGGGVEDDGNDGGGEGPEEDSVGGSPAPGPSPASRQSAPSAAPARGGPAAAPLKLEFPAEGGEVLKMLGDASPAPAWLETRRMEVDVPLGLTRLAPEQLQQVPAGLLINAMLRVRQQNRALRELAERKQEVERQIHAQMELLREAIDPAAIVLRRVAPPSLPPGVDAAAAAASPAAAAAAASDVVAERDRLREEIGLHQQRASGLIAEKAALARRVHEVSEEKATLLQSLRESIEALSQERLTLLDRIAALERERGDTHAVLEGHSEQMGAAAESLRVELKQAIADRDSFASAIEERDRQIAIQEALQLQLQARLDRHVEQTRELTAAWQQSQRAALESGARVESLELSLAELGAKLAAQREFIHGNGSGDAATSGVAAAAAAAEAKAELAVRAAAIEELRRGRTALQEQLNEQEQLTRALRSDLQELEAAYELAKTEKAKLAHRVRELQGQLELERARYSRAFREALAAAASLEEKSAVVRVFREMGADASTPNALDAAAAAAAAAEGGARGDDDDDELYRLEPRRGAGGAGGAGAGALAQGESSEASEERPGPPRGLVISILSFFFPALIDGGDEAEAEAETEADDASVQLEAESDGGGGGGGGEDAAAAEDEKAPLSPATATAAPSGEAAPAPATLPAAVAAGDDEKDGRAAAEGEDVAARASLADARGASEVSVSDTADVEEDG